MATRRPRVRTIGALIANGRHMHNRRNKGKAYRLGKGLVRKNRRNRRNKGVAFRLGKGLVRTNRRNGKSKRSMPKLAFARMNRRNRRNGTRKGQYRKTARRAYMNRRNRGFRLRSRRNGKHSHMGRYTYRGMRHNRRNGGVVGAIVDPVAKAVRPIPVVGGSLAKSILYAPTALGAFVGAEAGLQASALYAMLPTSGFLAPVGDFLKGLSVPGHFALVGFVGGGVVATLATKIGTPGIRRAAQAFGLAFTSGAWGVAWYELRKAQALAAAGIPDAVEQAGQASGEPTGALGAVMVGATPGLGAVMIGADTVMGGMHHSMGGAHQHSMGGMGPAYTVGPQGYGAVIVGG